MNLSDYFLAIALILMALGVCYLIYSGYSVWESFCVSNGYDGYKDGKCYKIINNTIEKSEYFDCIKGKCYWIEEVDCK